MAKTETGKPKKKGFVQRMMFGNDQKPDLTPEQMNTSKWALFRFLFFKRFGTMVLLNLLTVFFALPAAVVVILFMFNSSIASSYIPYSANLGIGYPVTTTAASQGMAVAFTYKTFEYLILVPCISFFALGVAGNLYVMRKLIWEQPTSTVKDFFRGIKNSWLSSLLIGLAFGLTLLLVAFTFDFFDVYNLSSALKGISITLAVILLVFMILFTSFFMTQNAAFKMRGMVLIRNSFLFVGGTNIQAILMIGLGVAPAFLIFVPGITVFLVLIYVFLGFSYTTLAVSLYCHSCYEKFLYDKVSDMPEAVYTRRKNDFDEDGQKSKKKKPAVQYKNPKKRKKSIDEGASITPLTPTFRREDLERLQREHELIMAESNTADDAPDEVAAADAVDTPQVPADPDSE